MKIIKPSVKILTTLNEESILKKLEKFGRVCYKSEHKITKNSAEAFIKKLIKNEHFSVLEHVHIPIRFICDRGVTHELVRHRLISASQESTRYCNYKNDITFIEPCFWDNNAVARVHWKNTVFVLEQTYKKLIAAGATPQEARTILPNSLKTEIIVTANVREWRHIIKLRTSPASHPQMREVMFILLKELQNKLPVLFGDIKYEKKVA